MHTVSFKNISSSFFRMMGSSTIEKRGPQITGSLRLAIDQVMMISYMVDGQHELYGHNSWDCQQGYWRRRRVMVVHSSSLTSSNEVGWTYRLRMKINRLLGYLLSRDFSHCNQCTSRCRRRVLFVGGQSSCSATRLVIWSYCQYNMFIVNLGFLFRAQPTLMTMERSAYIMDQILKKRSTSEDFLVSNRRNMWLWQR
jgi:hypothetical protein